MICNGDILSPYKVQVRIVNVICDFISFQGPKKNSRMFHKYAILCLSKFGQYLFIRDLYIQNWAKSLRILETKCKVE